MHKREQRNDMMSTTPINDSSESNDTMSPFISDLLALDSKQYAALINRYPQRVYSATLPAIELAVGATRSSRPRDLLMDDLFLYMEEASDGLYAGELTSRGLLSAIRHSKNPVRIRINLTFYHSRPYKRKRIDLLAAPCQIVLETLLDFLDLHHVPLCLECDEGCDFPELREDPPTLYPINLDLDVHLSVLIDRKHPRVEVEMLCLQQPH